MEKVIQFESGYIFCADILKVTDEAGNLNQKVYIGIRNKSNQKIIINPITSALKVWKSRKLYTQFQYAQKIVHFLNYVYFEKHLIKRFDEIEVSHVILFINSLTDEGQTRFYVSEHKRLLTTFFYYIVCHYNNICLISKDSFLINKKKNIIWPELDSQILLPSVSAGNSRRRNKITNLDLPLVLRFVELAMYETPNCALGFYFLFFGGLRAAEVCHLTDVDIPKQIVNKAYFSINLEDKIINEESKYADIAENKKNRKQVVLYIAELYDELFAEWKKMYKTGPVVQKRNGGGMTERGFSQNFEKVKKILIKKLSESDDEKDKILAITLASYKWSTHIGRGVFSNLIAQNAKNPYLISVARGDSSFKSALPYISESEKSLQDTTNILRNMYATLRNDADEENT